MKINRAYKYELKPNKEQRILLAKHAGAARFSYNWGLAVRISLYEKEKRSTNAIEQHRLLNSLKLADRWFVSLCTEVEIGDPKPIDGELVGIDMGLTHFASFSNGDKLLAPKPLSKSLKRLKIASKKHSRKVKSSNNRRKSALKLSRLHRKVRNIRKDFLHKESTKLAKTKSAIVIEDLDVKRMLENSNFGLQISDVGWGEFRQMLEYKTKWYGSKLIVAPRFYPSSKTCSECGNVICKLPLSIRVWQCENCKAIHDRDVNAGKNLVNWSTESSSGIYACGDPSYGASKSLLVMGR